MPALLAALSCLLAAIATFAMWEAVRAGQVATAGPISGFGATAVSGQLCVMLTRQHRWFGHILVVLVGAAAAVVAAYMFAEPFRRWADAVLRW